MSEEKKEEGEVAPKKEGGLKKMIPMIIMLVIFLGAQVGIAVFIAGKLKPEDPAQKALVEAQKLEKEETEKSSHFGTTLAKPIEVTVNLNENEGEHYLVAAVNFELDIPSLPGAGHGGGSGGGKPVASPLEVAIMSRMPKIKDMMIKMFSSKPISELKTVEGKNSILENLREDINATLPDTIGEIKNAYFEKFIIQ